MEFVQQTAECADFDVVLDDAEHPAFRLLVPEFVSAENVDLAALGAGGCLHVIPGRWERTVMGFEGEFAAGEALGISVRLAPQGKHVDLVLAVRNRTGLTLENVRADVCLSPNHLPGSPGWHNADFVACDEVDRDAQGRYWYERRTPKHLTAWADGRWMATHPHPENPDANRVDKYPQHPPPAFDTQAYAIASEDGRSLLFQMWNTPCHAGRPFPGNACLHLRPLMARSLAPDDEAVVQGRAGIFDGNRAELLGLLSTLP